jgi:hypothetical protein
MIGAHDLRELNRLLVIASDLRSGASALMKSSLLLACKQSTFQGGFQNHGAALDAALRLGLLVLQPNSRLEITDIGAHFLSLNPERYYELRTAQTPFLFKILVDEGPLRTQASEMAALMEADREVGTLSLSRTGLKRSSEEASSCFSALLVLGVFEPHGDSWRVRPNFLRQMSQLRQLACLRESEFQALLDEQAALGRAAEVLTVEYERRRLGNAEAMAEALLVSRVSEFDVGAGYDIESFAGRSPDLRPNLFIEVKASRHRRMRFFWTRNEYETALRLGSAYSIYFIGGFRPEKGLAAFSPRIIADPATTLPSLPNVHVEARVYLVTESKARTGGVDIEGVNLESL